MLAADDLVDMFEGDFRQLLKGTASHDEERIEALGGLPPQFMPRYDAGFASRFLTSVIELRDRLERSPWQPPSCVARELGLRLLLDQAEVRADLCGIHLMDGRRDRAAQDS